MGKRSQRFHSGIGHGLGFKADKRYVHNRKVLMKGDFGTTYVSGATAATAHHYGTGVPIDVWKFPNRADTSVGVNLVVPTGIPEKARLDVGLYWTTLSGIANDRLSGANVLWAVDYRSSGYLISGSQLADAISNYTLSGVLVNRASTTATYNAGAELISGAVNYDIVSIPAIEFRVGDILQLVIIRKGTEVLDTVAGEADLLAATIEYV